MRFPRLLACLSASVVLAVTAGSAALAEPDDPTSPASDVTETTTPAEPEPTTETTTPDPEPTTETTTPDPEPTTETTTSTEPPTTAAPTADTVTASIGEITRDECLVSIPVTTVGASTFTLEVWDDGTIIDTFEWTTTVDGTNTVIWTITRPAGASATGVGFYVMDENGSLLDSADPWEYPDEVADSCAAQVPVTVTLPDYSDSTEPGATLAIEGTGFLAGEDVEITFAGVLVATLVADGDGAISGSFVVPGDAADGPADVTATGVSSARAGTVPVVVSSVVEEAPTAIIGEITRDGCLVSIPVTTTGASTFTLEVWDDGELIDSFEWTTTVDGTQTVIWTITRPAGVSATGVGFYVVGGDGWALDAVDPWEYPDDVADTCSAAVPVSIAVSGYSGSSVAPGTTLTVTGDGFLPDEEVVVTFESTPVEVGSYITDADGAFTGEFVVPADATDGTHHVVGTGIESMRTGSDELVVLAPPSEAATGGLPDTGAESSAPLALAAVTMITAGAVLVLVRRRLVAMR